MTVARPSIYTTCPEIDGDRPRSVIDRVIETAQWCESHGHEGMLIRSGNRLVDPWAIAQLLLHETESLRPVVTVQPLYMHPYTVAKKVATLARIYGRCPDLYLVASGSSTDLLALDDRAAHDDRYRRLTEYVEVITALLTARRPITHVGECYRVYKPAALTPLADEQRPRFFMATSSGAGRQAALELGALPVSSLGLDDGAPCMLLGLLVRSSNEEAWEVARERFPADAAGRLAHGLDMAWSDSTWNERLSELADSDRPAPDRPWLGPFENRQSRSPYLVGDCRTAARGLQGALNAGAQTFFLEPPHCRADVQHASEALERAWTRSRSPLTLTGRENLARRAPR